MKSYKNLIFDLGQVIVPLSMEKTIEKFKNLGVETSLIDSICSGEPAKIFYDIEVGNISDTYFIDEMMCFCPQARNNQEIIDAWNAMLLDHVPQRIELLEKLSKQYNIFLLSNTNKIHYDYFTGQFKKMFGYEFDSLFKKAYYSHQLGMRKPDPNIFKYVLIDQNLEASETLFLDDNISNLESAKALGIDTQKIDREYTILEFFKI